MVVVKTAAEDVVSVAASVAVSILVVVAVAGTVVVLVVVLAVVVEGAAVWCAVVVAKDEWNMVDDAVESMVVDVMFLLPYSHRQTGQPKLST
jgi:hypothetical protein